MACAIVLYSINYDKLSISALSSPPLRYRSRISRSMRRGSVELDGEQFDKEGPQLLCRRRRLDRGRVDGQSRVKFRSKLAWSNEHPQVSSLQSNRKHTRPSTCIMVDFSIPPLLKYRDPRVALPPQPSVSGTDHANMRLVARG